MFSKLFGKKDKSESKVNNSTLNFIEIADLISNGNREIVGYTTVLVKNHEVFRLKFKELWDDLCVDLADELDSSWYIHIFVWWLANLQYCICVDWKESPEDIMWHVKNAVNKLEYSISFEELVYEDNENTYVFFGILNKHLERQGYRLISLEDDGTDCYTLFVVKSENVDKIISLTKEMDLEAHSDF